MIKLKSIRAKHVISFLFLTLSLSCTSLMVAADDNASQSLNELYNNIKQERSRQKLADKERESAFKQQEHEQKAKLKLLKKEHSEKKNELEKLKQNLIEVDKVISEKKHQLKERSHALKDLFSAWKQAVKDNTANMQSSIVFHQNSDKIEQIKNLGAQSSLPDAQDLRAIYEILQYDIQQSSQSLEYLGEYISESGQTQQAHIQRIGTFSSTSEGKFLLHNPSNNSLIALPSQPENSVRNIINSETYKSLTTEKIVNAVIDPSRGMVLEQLSLIPSWEERLHQGGYIGYLIIALGSFGILLSIFRWSTISYSQLAIKRQMLSPAAIDIRNPLGKIISAYQENLKQNKNLRDDEKIDSETLEVQLQEIVMSEMPKLDRGLGTIKLLAAVAPLLGLLGTVVGMINTFQSITLVGNAAPKLMAGGISQALMTTVLGLLVAVPLLFSHNLLAAKTKKTIMFLTQQSLGFIVKHMQDKRQPQGESINTAQTSDKES